MKKHAVAAPGQAAFDFTEEALSETPAAPAAVGKAPAPIRIFAGRSHIGGYRNFGYDAGMVRLCEHKEPIPLEVEVLAEPIENCHFAFQIRSGSLICISPSHEYLLSCSPDKFRQLISDKQGKIVAISIREL